MFSIIFSDTYIKRWFKINKKMYYFLAPLISRSKKDLFRYIKDESILKNQPFRQMKKNIWESVRDLRKNNQWRPTKLSAQQKRNMPDKALARR